jgi:hypothetical protein
MTSPPGPVLMSRRKANWFWLAAYLLVVTAVVVVMLQARRVTLRELGTPEAKARWQAWREAEPNRPHTGPVERRPPSADEPPALILLRDHFGVMMAAALGFGSLVFAAIMVAARGAFASSEHPPDSGPATSLSGRGRG